MTLRFEPIEEIDEISRLFRVAEVWGACAHPYTFSINPLRRPKPRAAARSRHCSGRTKPNGERP